MYQALIESKLVMVFLYGEKHMWINFRPLKLNKKTEYKTLFLKKDSKYYTKFLYSKINVLSTQQLFYKVSWLYIIKKKSCFKQNMNIILEEYLY